MSISVFDLFATLKLDSSEYDSGLSQSENKGESFGKKISTGLGKAAKAGAAAVAGIATATAAVSAAFVKGTSNVAAYGDNIDKMSQKMGISAQAYQEWDAVMQHSGTSIDGMKRGMTTLATQAEKNASEFQKLGISQKDLAEMSQEELFAKTIEGLQNMESGTERTVTAQKLLGGSAKELGALLNTSAEETQAMKDRVHELGGVMSDDAIKASAAYQDQLQDMQTAFSGLSRNMTAEFLPAVTTVMDGLTRIFSGDSENGIGLISDGIKSITDGISEALPNVIETGSKIVLALSEAITSNLPTLIPAVVSGLLTVSLGIAQQLPTILQSIITGILAAAPSFLEAGKKLFQMVGDGIKSAASIVQTNGNNVIDKVLNTITKNLPKFLDNGVKLITNLASGLLNALPTVITKAGEIMSKLINFFVENAPTMAEKGVDLIVKLAQGLVQALPNIVSSAMQVTAKLIQQILEALPKLIEAGFKLIGKLAAGIIKGIPDAVKAAKSIVDKASETFKTFDWLSLGINIVKGIISGLTSMGSAVITAMLGLAKGAFDAVKNFFGIKSPSKKMRDEIGHNIVDGMIKGIDDKKENAKKSAEQLSSLYVSTAKTKLSALKENNEISLEEEWAYWLEVREHVKKGTKAYDEATAQIGKAKKAYAENAKKEREELIKNVNDLNKEYMDGVKKVIEDLDAQTKALTDAYNKAVQDRKNSLMGQMSLFETFTPKEGKAGQDLITGMESQMQAMAEYDSTMTTLQSRIGETAPALYGELQNMNVDQIETLKTIAAMSDEELQYYVSLYDAKQMFAEDRAKRDNEELKKQTDEQIEQLKNNADEQLNTLEETYKTGIKKIGKMGEKEFKKAGKQSIKGMGVGMNTEFDALEKQMKARAAALVAAVQAALRIHSPSRVFADEVGKFIPLGIAEGVEKAMPTAERSILADIEDMKNAAVDVVGNGYTSSMGAGANSSPVTMLLAAIYDAITGMPDDMTQSFGEALTNTTFSMNDREFARLVKAV